MRRSLQILLLGLLTTAALHADGPAFDLSGPKVDVRVKRGEVTLPIGETPNLMPGDRLWIHPDFPENQATHFVLVVAFLRGSTNQPPPEWFTRVETWSREAREEGVFVTVPAEAQQALLFLAPETGGDFSTLRNAVRGRPGAFVRATQDLQAASWDRMRLDAYLTEVKLTSQSDPKLLKERAELAARSLGIRVEQQCFDKPTDQQAPCLVQHTDGLVLDDANAQSLVAQLASGSTIDLMNQIIYSPMGGSGALSPYVGAIVDTAKILSSMHTAHFQYIPALALPAKDTLNLRLNMPPSFRDPKSVVVVALPPMGATKPPPLRPVNAPDSLCSQKSGLVLQAEGAPLVFATQLTHDLTLHIDAKGGPIELPLKVDSAQGGLVLAGPMPTLPGGDLTATVRGKWGFDDWEGPRFHLRAPEAGQWNLAAGDQSALIVGRDDLIHLEGKSSLCVERVEERLGNGNSFKLNWKSSKPETMEIAVPMKDAAPGPVFLDIYQAGLAKPDTLPLQAYAEAASLDRLTLSVGDADALLKGNRLDTVAKVELEKITWTPATLSRVEGYDLLKLNALAPTTSLEPGKEYVAKVELRDGRHLKVQVTVAPPRPQVVLLNKGTQENDSATVASPVHLGSPDDLPLGEKMVFFLKSTVPANFPRDEKVEVAAVDGSFRTELTMADGSLMLEDAKTAIGTVEPLVRFGASAFGPVQARALAANGEAGDWLPLGTLVRLPGFKELHCSRVVTKPCTLTGSNLFLALSVAPTPDFENSTDVPSEFTGTQLSVPHPNNGILYLKLRDDPSTTQTLTLPILLTARNDQIPGSENAAQDAQSATQAESRSASQIAVPPAAEQGQAR
jgi:hypothetical protein